MHARCRTGSLVIASEFDITNNDDKGAIAIECRDDDEETKQLVSVLNHRETSM